MTSKRLGALLRSVPPATAHAEELERQLHASDVSVRMRVEAQVPLQVLVPKHVRTQLGVMAAKEGKSLRAVVLTAIRSLGISRTDEEIREKRGRRKV